MVLKMAAVAPCALHVCVLVIQSLFLAYFPFVLTGATFVLERVDSENFVRQILILEGYNL